MAKIDYERYTLPDIEMYAGNTDVWEFPLFDSNRMPFLYTDMNGYTFKLIIEDYGYVRRKQEGSHSHEPIIKSGTLCRDDNGHAFVRFEFTKAETNLISGKYTYQIEAEGGSKYFSAQGSLYIIKNINQ